jgi:two-component system, LuxR family, sensor kinase FixL
MAAARASSWARSGPSSFDGFFTTEEEGMGLGLAICQSVMAAHGGGIAVSNSPEGGACFRLWIPA